MKNSLKKILISVFTLFYLLVGNSRIAFAIPTAPEAPTAPTAPSAPSDPPVAPAPPAPPENVIQPPTAPTAPQQPGTDTTSQTQTTDNNHETSGSVSGTSGTTSSGTDTTSGSGSTTGTSGTTNSDPQALQTAVIPTVQTSGGITSNEGMGSAVVSSGNADNTANILNSTNSNLLASGSGGAGGVTVVNSGNAGGSTNSGSATVANNTDTTQSNSSVVTNNLAQGANSGYNEASKNMGDGQITTGSADTTGTIINAINTNVAGTLVSEFNVVNDTVGDIILNFDPNSSCGNNCTNTTLAAANVSNGPNSTNTTGVDTTNNSTTFQKNDATVLNDMTLGANSGSNNADKNMGTGSITTGDANVAANILNYANNNIAGDVVYAVVNIFGNLTGDIILPESSLNSCCATGSVTAANTGNSSGSTNTANVSQTATDATNQFNNAVIDNNLTFNANTGGNNLDKNMNGDSNITTGDSSVVAQVLNVVNSNIIDGNTWLVIVNEAGKWIGKIIGAPAGSNLAGSDGFQFTVDDQGNVTAVNAGNGPDTTNTTNVTTTDNQSTTQTNTANIVNNVNLSANTGKNSADKNMGGSSITTGDANIVANIVNFVNNNVKGTGKLFVTVVNVFGNWFGDFVTPGQHKENAPTASSGGVGGESNGGSGGGSGSNQSDNNSNSGGGSSVLSTSSSNENSDPVTNKGVISDAAWSSTEPTPSFENGDLLAANITDGSAAEFANISDAAKSMTTQAGRKIVNINLAWGIFILPLLLGGYLIRRKLRARVLPQTS